MERRVPPVVLVVTESWNKLTDKALRFALSLSPEVIAVHFTQLAGPGTYENLEHVATPPELDAENVTQRAAEAAAPLERSD